MSEHTYAVLIIADVDGERVEVHDTVRAKSLDEATSKARQIAEQYSVAYIEEIARIS